MTNEQVRVWLEGINFHELWDECLRQEPKYEDSFMSDILEALRLLAAILATDEQVLIKEQKAKIKTLKGMLQNLLDAGVMSDDMRVLSITISEPLFAEINQATKKSGD